MVKFSKKSILQSDKNHRHSFQIELYFNMMQLYFDMILLIVLYLIILQNYYSIYKKSSSGTFYFTLAYFDINHEIIYKQLIFYFQRRYY